MKFEVCLTRRAARDLEEAYRWYADRSPESAAAWHEGFVHALETLASNPQRCNVAQESLKFPFQIRQLLFGKRRAYRALFTIRGNAVVVLHIRHTARREFTPDDLE